MIWPPTPSVGDKITGPFGEVYNYDSVKWTLIEGEGIPTPPSGNQVYIGATPPGTKEPGDLWWRTTDSQLYIWDSAQWVVVVNQPSGMLDPTTPGNFLRTDTGAWVEGVSLSALSGGNRWDGLIKGTGTDFGWAVLGARTNSNTVLTGFNPTATGSGNVVAGTAAFNDASSGSNNVALGLTALQYGNAASGNVAVGAGAMWASYTVSNTVALGMNALRNFTGGSGSVGIGHSAGVYLLDGTTTMNSAGNGVYIGVNARSGSDIQSPGNEVVVGGNAIGHGSNTATLGNASVTKLWLGNTQIHPRMGVTDGSNPAPGEVGELWGGATLDFISDTDPSPLTVGTIPAGDWLMSGTILFGTSFAPSQVAFVAADIGNNLSWPGCGNSLLLPQTPQDPYANGGYLRNTTVSLTPRRLSGASAMTVRVAYVIENNTSPPLRIWPFLVARRIR